MDLMLADNIRRFRKERKLTQEQFAEIFDITPGAVYKWESGQSVPELHFIVEMADFFDTSVDVLLGYRMKDNNIKAVVQRLIALYQERSADVLVEAEKALKKYPNLFEVVNTAAMVYRLTGIEQKDAARLRRSVELSKQALLLVSQNEDERTGELSIYGDMADAYIHLGNYEMGIELLKKHNINGIFSEWIGSALARSGKTEDAVPFITETMLDAVSKMISAMFSLSLVACKGGKFSEAREIMQFGQGLLVSLRKDGKTDLLDKIAAEMQIIVAFSYLKEGDADAAQDAARKALEMAHRFDAAPDYSLSSVKFITPGEDVITTDSLGSTAVSGIETIIAFTQDAELSALWNRIAHT